MGRALGSPRWFPPGFPLAHSDSCGVVRRNPQLDGEWLLLEFVREEGPHRSVAMGVLRWLVLGVGGEPHSYRCGLRGGGEPHSYRCGLGGGPNRSLFARPALAELKSALLVRPVRCACGR